MTASQKLAKRISEIRQRLNEINTLDGEKYTDEVKTEERNLQSEYSDIEVRYRSALITEETEETEQRDLDVDGEARELRELRGRVRVSNFATAALDQSAVSGAEQEYCQALEIPVNRFPLDLLAPEERATTSADGQSTQRSWLDRLFSDTAAMSLGISFESVGPGMASYPVTTAGASAAQRGKADATADAAWTVGVSELKPTRNSVRAVFSGADADRLPSLEESLRRDLSMALTEGIDRVVFLGDEGANAKTADEADIKGLTTISNVVEKSLTQTDKLLPNKFAEALASLIDGKHAASAGDLRIVMSEGANTLTLSTITGTGSQVSLAKFLMDNGFSWTVRGDIETATAAGDWGAFIGRGRRIQGAGVAPVWRSAQLVRDPYTGAAKDEVALTLITSWNFALVRPAQFARLKFAA